MNPLIFQSDFGKADGAVCAMYGVAEAVCDKLRVYDLTHDIPQYDVWEASYRLIQAICYWPAGSVFVSVVDPGVGSDRRSLCIQTKAGQFVITPDNGTLTHVKRMLGIAEARVIDEEKNRLPNSGESYTFHGRDIFAYTGARLAAGLISFEQVGPEIPAEEIIELPVVPPALENDIVTGTVDVLDVRFGSLWTNIDSQLFHRLNVPAGDRIEVTISNGTRMLYKNIMTYAHSFADVNVGEPLIYINSLGCVGIAINQGSFARAYNIGTGISWHVSLRKAPRVIYD